LCSFAGFKGGDILKIHRRFNLSFIILLMIVLPFVLNSFCANAEVKKITPKVKTIIKKPIKIDNNTFTLIISKGVKGCLSGKETTLFKKDFKVDNKKDVLAFLKENSEVIESGGFIKYINGLKSVYPVPSDQMNDILKAKGVLGADWFIYLNSKKTLVGASAIFPKKGDIVMIDYHYWNKDEFNVNNN
jgi:hypothetical protein